MGTSKAPGDSMQTRLRTSGLEEEFGTGFMLSHEHSHSLHKRCWESLGKCLSE